ncbi:MAG: hypothetical protein NVS4B10_07670 [Myxococcales bacterium]
MRGAAARYSVPMRPSARLGLFIALTSFSAFAQDRFEIQVYDSEVAEPGHFGLELHTNYVLKGSRSTPPEGELATQHVLHLTLEPHLGVFGWGEVGAYLQSALRPEGSFDYAGVKLRFKAKWPEKFFNEMLGLALNVEVSRIPKAYEPNVWSSELRPTIDLRAGSFYASVNPIIATDIQGPIAGHPQFEPAFKVAVFARPELSLGSEYYAALGPFEAFLPAAEQSHRLYGVVDFASDYVDFNLGVGRGFGSAEPWVAKAIFGIHPPGTPPSHTPPPETAPR